MGAFLVKRVVHGATRDQEHHDDTYVCMTKGGMDAESSANGLLVSIK